MKKVTLCYVDLGGWGHTATHGIKYTAAHSMNTLNSVFILTHPWLFQIDYQRSQQQLLSFMLTIYSSMKGWNKSKPSLTILVHNCPSFPLTKASCKLCINPWTGVGQLWCPSNYRNLWMCPSLAVCEGYDREGLNMQAVSMWRLCVWTVIVNLWDLKAPTLVSRGCLSDGQGSQHNRGMLEQGDIPLISRWALWPWTTPIR